MSHSKSSTKNHALQELIARSYTGRWYTVECKLEISTAANLLTACGPHCDLYLMGHGANIRAIDWLGKPVVLTVMGRDVMLQLLEKTGSDHKAQTADVIRALQHARAERAETHLCVRHLDGLTSCHMDPKYGSKFVADPTFPVHPTLRKILAEAHHE